MTCLALLPLTPCMHAYMFSAGKPVSEQAAVLSMLHGMALMTFSAQLMSRKSGSTETQPYNV